MARQRTTKINVLVKYRDAKRVDVTGRLVRMMTPAEITEVRAYVDNVRASIASRR